MYHLCSDSEGEDEKHYGQAVYHLCSDSKGEDEQEKDGNKVAEKKVSKPAPVSTSPVSGAEDEDVQEHHNEAVSSYCSEVRDLGAYPM